MADISVPKSIQATWDKVSSDKTITKSEYKELVQAAAQDNDISDEEFKMLSEIKNKLKDSKTESVKIKEGVAKGTFSFVDNPKYQSLLLDLEPAKPVKKPDSDISNKKLNLPEKVFDMNNVSEIKVKPGETFAIRVPSNGSVGYNWDLKTKDFKNLSSKDTQNNINTKPGATSETFYIFKADSKGNINLDFNCNKRPGLSMPDNKSINIIVE